jgi:hypothetical protein
MVPAEPRNKKNRAWKLKDEEKYLQQCRGESKSLKTAHAGRGQEAKWEIPNEFDK